MRNKAKIDFRKYEIITVILLLLLIFTGLLNMSLCGANAQRIKTMRNSANQVRDIVSMNVGNFQNDEKVYLGEVLDEELIKEVKSPVSSGTCSSSESYVELIDDKYQVTLKCGDYLIDKATFVGNDMGVFYKVSDWSLSKSKNDNEKEVLFNCKINGKEKYPDYYEKEYFIYNINKDFNQNYSSIKEIKENLCHVISKTFYREKTVYDEK